MSKPIYFTNEEILQNAKVLFETIENNSTIAQKLDDYGYPAEEIAKGKALYQTAQTQYGSNRKETEEERIAHLNFKQKMDNVAKLYKEHRNKAKLVFKKNEEAKISLALKGSPAQAIVALLEEMTAFYLTLSQKEPLKRLTKSENYPRHHHQTAKRNRGYQRVIYYLFARKKRKRTGHQRQK